MQELDGIFLDFYGTLVGGDKAAVESCCRRIVEDFSLPVTVEQLAFEWGKGYFALSETCNDGDFRTLYQIECDSLVDCLEPMLGRRIDPKPYVVGLTDWLRKPPMYEETRQVLNELNQRGVPLCIVSNADYGDLMAAIEHIGIRVDHVVTSQCAKSYKPDSRIFHQALEKTGWKRENVFHVGDSLHSDVGGAKAIGLRAVWVCRSQRITDIGTEQPHHRIDDLRGLLSLHG